MWALTLALLAVQQVDVAAGDEEMFALDEEMVSTASRTSEPIRKAPASVSVVTERELRAFDFTYTADALLGVRGLFLNDDKLYTSLGVRGFNRFGDYGNRVQVQMDGHVMNDDWIFSSYIGSDQMTDIHHVESIEVVRGPGSALYGTGAFFGIINLKTPRKAQPYTLRLGVGVVDQSTLRAHVDAGQDLSEIFGVDAGLWVSSAGSALPGRDYVSEVSGIAQGVDAFSTATTTGKAWYGDFTLAYSIHQRDRRVPTGHFETTFGDRRNIATDRRAFAELRYEPQVTSWLQLLTRAYVDHQSYDGTYAATSPDFFLASEHAEGNWGGVEARALMTPLDDDTLRITAGAQVETHPLNRWLGKDTPTSEPYQDQSSVFHYVSTYGIADWQPFTWLLLSGGARFDGWILGGAATYGEEPASDATAFIPSLNPRLAVIWMPSDEDTLKLMAGRAYRVPSTYELTYSLGGLDFTNGATLAPETMYNSELEYRRRVAPSTHVTASLYANQVSDLITYLTPEDDPDGEAYYNVAEPVYTAGAELELRYDMPHGVLAAAQMSFQRTRVGDLFEGEAVPNSPERVIAAWLIIPLVGGNTSVDCNGPGRCTSLDLAQRVVHDQGRLDRELGAVQEFVTWDAMLTARFQEVPFTFTVGVDNVLDARNVHPVSDNVSDLTVRQDGRRLRMEVFAWF